MSELVNSEGGDRARWYDRAGDELTQLTAKSAVPSVEEETPLPAVIPHGIGPVLRAARRERGMTGRELARRVGVSPSLISHLEGGRQRPSRRTLERILSELELDPEELLRRRGSAPAVAEVRQPLDVLSALASFSSQASEGPAAVQRADERGVLHFPAGMRYALLTKQRDPEIDFFEVHLEPGGASDPQGKLHVHPGREFGVVLSGSIRVTVGDEQFVLAAGDSIAFESTIPHRSENASDQEAARLMWVCLNRP